MASRRIINYKLVILANISIIWVVFAFLFLYNIILIEEKFKITGGRSFLLFSIAFASIGFAVSAVLVFYLKNAFRHYPLWFSVLMKMIFAFGLFLLIAIAMLMVYYIFYQPRSLDH